MKPLLSFFAALLISFSGPVMASKLVEVAAKYDSQVDYEVFRNGKPVGSYKLNFSTSGQDDLTVAVEMDLSMKIFGLFNYEYYYGAAERWRQDRLTELRVTIDDDGDQEAISADRVGESIRVSDANGETRDLHGGLITTHHWYVGILEQPEVLNTLTGEASKLDVKQETSAEWVIDGQNLQVSGYRLGGDLDDTLSWYDQQGIWRGMEFSAGDGSTIQVKWMGAEIIEGTT